MEYSILFHLTKQGDITLIEDFFILQLCLIGIYVLSYPSLVLSWSFVY